MTKYSDPCEVPSLEPSLSRAAWRIKMEFILTGDEILERGLALVQKNRSRADNRRRSARIATFNAHFGSYPHVCAILWEKLQRTNIPAAKIEVTRGNFESMLKYFLMAQFYLRNYPVEEVGASLFGVSPPTFREQVDSILCNIQALMEEMVGFECNHKFDRYSCCSHVLFLTL
jgi:hypothetical protein